MEVYSAAFIAAITPQILAALIGGFIGVNISSDVKMYGYRLTILTAILVLSMVGASSEFISYKWEIYSIIGHSCIGGLVGMAGMRLLDAVRIALPDFMTELTKLAGKSSLEIIVVIFKKLKKIAGL